MYILLKDGTKLNHIGATGGSRYIQGANRDAITFEFSRESYTLDELRNYFTEINCETINIVTDGGVEVLEDGTKVPVLINNYWDDYVIRHEVAERVKVIEEATGTTPEITEVRLFVTMAQRTYAEYKLAAISEEVTNTQLALCEVYEMMG